MKTRKNSVKIKRDVKILQEVKTRRDVKVPRDVKVTRPYIDAPNYHEIPSVSEQKGEEFSWTIKAPEDRSWMATLLAGGSKQGGERFSPVPMKRPTSPDPKTLSSGVHFLVGPPDRKSVILNLFPDESLTGRIGLTLQAFQEFGSMTTFHGLRYVLAPDTHLFRRFLWLSLVVLCFVIVTIQLLVQYKLYMEKPTSIKVDKIYTDYTEFPSVTICNDNVYRISAAHKEGLLTVIKKLYDNQLTLEDVYAAGVANLTLDQLNLKVGNRIDNMLLSCKWHGHNKCSSQNFSTTMTDFGLCFTFNGPDYRSLLRATSPDAPGGWGAKLSLRRTCSSRGLELVLNIEEYERMAGPKVESGIHIFVQNKRDYPLVEQRGQAIAAGSHAFIALNLKKENRLGLPYDNCKDGRMEHVSRKTYRYSMATCKMDCYVSFVVNKCGCKDFYLPGNFPVCNMAIFISCLKGAQHEYEAVRDKACGCYNPCSSQFLEPLYSYSALSKYAHNVLNPGEKDRIMNRFKWALDINEYYNAENQYKKTRYRNFTLSVNRLNAFYEQVLGFRFLTIINNLEQVHEQANMIVLMSEELLNAQACFYEEVFLKSSHVNLLKLTKNLAGDHTNFGIAVEYKLNSITSSTEPDFQNIMYNLLKEDIKIGIDTIEDGNDVIYKLAQSFEDVPLVQGQSTCVKYKYFKGINANTIMPRVVLKEALGNSMEKLHSGNYTRKITRVATDLLGQLMDVVKVVHEEKNITEAIEQDITRIVSSYSEACTTLLFEQDDFVRETVQWPSKKLKEYRNEIALRMEECQSKLSNDLNELVRTFKSLNRVKEYLKEYKKIIPILNQYLMHFNVSKFKIAELFNERNSEEVWVWMEQMRVSISSSIDHIIHSLNKVLECYTRLYSELFANNDIYRAYELKGGAFNVSQVFRESLFNDTFASLDDLRTLRSIRALHTDHLALARDIQMDANQFSNQAVIDVTFYSKNFIFLNIFFSEISYTMTEQQVAYDIFQLIGDIGGSMGVLIGGSILSLFEILDFIICLCVSLLKWTP